MDFTLGKMFKSNTQNKSILTTGNIFGLLSWLWLAKKACFDWVETAVRIAEHCPVWCRCEVLFGGEWLATRNETVKLVIVNPRVPTSIDFVLTRKFINVENYD